MSKLSEAEKAAIYENAMSRDEVLRPGHYVAIPKAWLADETLTVGAKLVLMIYIEHLGPKNRDAWPGHETIAQKTGMSPRGVQNCIEQLVERGWMTSPGFSPDATRIYCVNRVRRTEGNAKSALPSKAERTQKMRSPNDPKGTQKVRSPARKKCVPHPEKSADEVPKGVITEGATEVLAGQSAGGAAVRPAATGSPDPVGSTATIEAGTAATQTLPAHSPAQPVATHAADQRPHAYARGYDSAEVDDEPDGYFDGPTGPTIDDEDDLARAGMIDRPAGHPVATQPAERPQAAAVAIVEASTGQTPIEADERPVGPAVAAGGAAKRSAKGTKAKVTRKAKEPGLTDEAKERACGSFDAMRDYIRFGAAALRPDADPTSLPSARTDYRKFAKSDEDLGVEHWGVHEFGGYFAAKLALARVNAGQRLMMPNWGRIFAGVKAMLDRMTRAEVLRRINITTDHFATICEMNGAIGQTMPLDESVLQHRLVESAVTKILLLDEPGLREMLGEIERRKTARERRAA